MTSTIERYDTATGGFRRRLQPLGEVDFERTSPCEGWSAGTLVDHSTDVLVLIGNLVGDPVDDDRGSTRIVRFDRASLALRTKVADEALATVVTDSPFGTLALKQLVSSVVVHDLLVHTWDLARATGGDEQLDQELVAHTLASMTPFDEMLRAHGFGPKLDPPDGADVQTELLCFLGRRP
jgi:uncharacterized protein (TIGR03086 family)